MTDFSFEGLGGILCEDLGLLALEVCAYLMGMAVEYGDEVLTDAEWKILHPLIEASRPRGKTPPQHLRRTITAILWRHTNGAKWRSIPPDRDVGSCPETRRKGLKIPRPSGVPVRARQRAP